jgi:hypothetical protein
MWEDGMADRSSGEGDQTSGPLFKNIDEQERLFAPEEFPDTSLPAHEVDAGGAAGSDTTWSTEPPEGAPIAAPGNAPSAAMAPAGQRKTRDGDEVPDSPDPLGSHR